MKTLLVLALALVGCETAPLAEHCKNGLSCEAGDWCVTSWQGATKTPAGNICSSGCSSGSECESGCCAQIGDGVGSPEVLGAPFLACAPASVCH